MQGFEFIVCNIGALVFFETKNEEPATSLVGGNQCSGTSAFAAPGKPDTLLDHPAAQFGIDQPLSHFDDNGTKQAVNWPALCLPRY